MKAQILIQKLQELDEAFDNPEIIFGLYGDYLQDFLILFGHLKDNAQNTVTLQLQSWEYKEKIK